MRHGNKFNHLGRKAAHRKAMLANMACSLVEHKSIKTTLAKAKALRKYVEPLITKSKNDTTHSRRTVFSYLKQKEAITELFGDIASKVEKREGGYTRILKLSNRLGDNAQMALIQLVDFNETYSSENNKKKKKKTRRRNSSSNPSNVVESKSIIEDAVVIDEKEVLVENKSENNDSSSSDTKLDLSIESDIVKNEIVEDKKDSKDSSEEDKVD